MLLKFFLLITSIFSVSTYKQGNTSHVSFRPEDVVNILHVATQVPPGDKLKVVTDIFDFLKRNPGVYKSFMTELDRPENGDALDAALIQILRVYSDPKPADIHVLGVVAVRLLQDDPKFFKLTESFGNRLYKENPTVVDDFYEVLEKAVRLDPVITNLAIDHLILIGKYAIKDWVKGISVLLNAGSGHSDYLSDVVLQFLKLDKLGKDLLIKKGGDVCTLPRNLE